MPLPETPSNVEATPSRKDRKARHAPKTYKTPSSHFANDKDPDNTPTTLQHPYYKDVGLGNLLQRVRQRYKEVYGDLPPHDLITGRLIYDGENSQLSHTAHQQISFLDFFRFSEAIGVKYLNPHSTGNVMESLVDVHNLYNQFCDILLPLEDKLEQFDVFIKENMDLIRSGKRPKSIFETEGFEKTTLSDYDWTCLKRKTPLHVMRREDGSLILDQIADPGRQIAMPAHGFRVSGSPIYFVYAFLGSAYALNFHGESTEVWDTLSESQRARAELIRVTARKMNLFKRMTAEEHDRLLAAGFAPRDIEMFRKLTWGEALYRKDGNCQIEVKFDPNLWKLSLQPGSPTQSNSPEQDSSYVEDTSIEQEDHPAKQWGITRAQQQMRRKKHPPSKWRYTPKLTLEKNKARREEIKEEKECAEVEELLLTRPGNPTPFDDTPSRPPVTPVKRQLGPSQDPEDPFYDGADAAERPLKRTRRTTTGPPRSRPPPASKAKSRSTRTQHALPAAMREPQLLPSQPVADPGPIPAASSTRSRHALPAAMQEPQYPPSQSVAGPGPVPAASSTRTRHALPAAMQELQYRPPSQPVAGPGPRTAANQSRAAPRTEQHTLAGGIFPGMAHNFHFSVDQASRSRLTESTFASRARARTRAESQPSRTSGPALPKSTKDKDKDKDKSTRR